MSKQSIH